MAMSGNQGQFEVDAISAVAEPTGPQIAGRSPAQIARARFLRDKASIAAAVVAGLYLLLAIAAPLLAKFEVIDPYNGNPDLIKGIGSTPTGNMGGISAGHLLGVEPGTGRDLLSRVFVGISTSLTVAVGATIISVVLGVVLGIISGYKGGKIDWLIGRVMDLVLSFPSTLMLIAMSIVVIRLIGGVVTPEDDVSNEARIIYLILFLGFFGWPGVARVIRGQVLSLREREFVEAAKSLGARSNRIFFKELLPNLWAPILVYTTLILPANISAEAALSFLGVGIQAPLPSLGVLLNNSVNYAIADPAFFFIPGALLIIAVISFNILGDGLTDALDPKADRR